MRLSRFLPEVLSEVPWSHQTLQDGIPLYFRGGPCIHSVCFCRFEFTHTASHVAVGLQTGTPRLERQWWVSTRAARSPHYTPCLPSMHRKMMDVKGPFPKRMLKKGAFTAKHFESDPGMSFKLYEDDPVTRKPVCNYTR